MLDFHAITIIGKQRQLELEAEAKIYRLIKESKKKKIEKRQSKHSYSLKETVLNTRFNIWVNTILNTMLNTIGKFLESLGKALQKKSQTC
ncbi:MAG: hypothetical protein KAR45_23645 [Desulfobacteraceae bacterium]|nr:hypothetical protein [Desulfobacteraceae bacterium]